MKQNLFHIPLSEAVSNSDDWLHHGCIKSSDGWPLWKTVHTLNMSSSPPPSSNSQSEQPPAAALSYKSPHNAIQQQTTEKETSGPAFTLNQTTDTKMKTAQLLILLVTILVHAAVGFPTDRRAPAGRDKHASWDDVNVVAHGLLQLGQGLKEHVDKAKAQMRDVNAKLKAFNGTVADLERKQQEQDEALKARSKEVEERERLAADLAEEVRVKVEEVKKQSEDLHSRMDRLEEKVDEVQVVDSNNSDNTFIQVREIYYFHVVVIPQLDKDFCNE